jgi:non-heme chloroperoxidase
MTETAAKIINRTFIEVEAGVRVFIQDWGEGKPIVLVHGFPFNGRIFDAQTTELSERGYRTVTIDLRGFGRSDKTWAGNDYDTWAKDIRTVIETLDLRDAALVGFSMGGAVAAHYAATQTDGRVTKLILLAAAAPIAAPRPEDKQLIDGFIEGLKTDQHAFSTAFVQNAFSKPLSPEYLRFVSEMGGQASLRTLIRAQEELRSRDLVEEMSGIKIPTLICHGTLDKVVPFAAGEAQAQIIEGAKLVRFESSNHGLFYDERDKLTDEIAGFVN